MRPLPSPPVSRRAPVVAPRADPQRLQQCCTFSGAFSFFLNTFLLSTGAEVYSVSHKPPRQQWLRPLSIDFPTTTTHYHADQGIYPHLKCFLIFFPILLPARSCSSPAGPCTWRAAARGHGRCRSTQLLPHSASQINAGSGQ